MLDTSGSMTFSDGTESRMVQAQQLLTPDSLEDIAEIYSILPYGFDGSATPMDTFSALPEPGKPQIWASPSCRPCGMPAAPPWVR